MVVAGRAIMESHSHNCQRVAAGRAIMGSHGCGHQGSESQSPVRRAEAVMSAGEVAARLAIMVAATREVTIIAAGRSKWKKVRLQTDTNRRFGA
jgi:hypothetical protein